MALLINPSLCFASGNIFCDLWPGREHQSRDEHAEVFGSGRTVFRSQPDFNCRSHSLCETGFLVCIGSSVNGGL